MNEHHSPLLARARALTALLAERAEEAERLRRLPDEVATAVREAGLHRIVQPAARGGSELDILAHVQVSAELARACSSTGWVVAVYGMHNWVGAMFPVGGQEELWADPSCFSHASVTALGSVQRTTAGYRLSGRWPFASGIDHTDWSIFAAKLPTRDNAPPETVLLLVPRAQVKVLDTWQVAGLRGTGSTDVEVHDVFVPAQRALLARDVAAGTAPGLQVNSSPLYRAPFRGMMIVALVAPALGAAAGAVAALTERMRRRVHAQTGIAQATSAPARIALAEAAVNSDTARLLTESLCRDLMAAAHAPQPPSSMEQARYLRDCAFAVQLCARAVDTALANSGGGALHDSSPIQRYWRDVHAIALHAGLSWHSHGDGYGRAVLGAV